MDDFYEWWDNAKWDFLDQESAAESAWEACLAINYARKSQPCPRCKELESELADSYETIKCLEEKRKKLEEELAQSDETIKAVVLQVSDTVLGHEALKAKVRECVKFVETDIYNLIPSGDSSFSEQGRDIWPARMKQIKAKLKEALDE